MMKFILRIKIKELEKENDHFSKIIKSLESTKTKQFILF